MRQREPLSVRVEQLGQPAAGVLRGNAVAVGVGDPGELAADELRNRAVPLPQLEDVAPLVDQQVVIAWFGGVRTGCRRGEGERRGARIGDDDFTVAFDRKRLEPRIGGSPAVAKRPQRIFAGGCRLEAAIDR